MKINELQNSVTLFADGEDDTVCEWTKICPYDENGLIIDCNSCPAHNLEEKVDSSDARKFWEQAEIKKDNY